MGRLGGDSGFTLVELVVGATIGSVVMLALFTLVDASMRTSTRIENRADSAQRGRNGMEQMVQAMRSSVCIKKSPSVVLLPITAGTNSAAQDTVTFYARLAKPSGTYGANGTDAFQPLQWQLIYDDATHRITEKTWKGDGDTVPYPNTTYPATTTTPTTTRTVLANVRRIPGLPVFSFYKYQADGTVDPYRTPADTPLTASPALSTSDLALVAMVRIAFRAGPLGNSINDPRSDSTFDEATRLRLIDPSTFSNGAVCRA